MKELIKVHIMIHINQIMNILNKNSAFKFCKIDVKNGAILEMSG